MNAKSITLITLLSPIIIHSSQNIRLLPVYEETESCTTTTSSDELKKILQYNIKQVKKLEQEINNDALSYTYENSNNDENKTIEELMNEWDQKRNFLQQQQGDISRINRDWKEKVGCCFSETPHLTPTLKEKPSLGYGIFFANTMFGVGGVTSGLLLNVTINMIENLYPECNNPYDYEKKCESDFFYPNTVGYIITGGIAGLTIGNILVARAQCLSKQFEEKYPRYYAAKQALVKTKNKIKDMRFNK